MQESLNKKISESRLVPLLVLCVVIATVILIPLKIIGYGYLPVDDALRHAAKAVSDKDWEEILVLREDIKMDSHPGWHSILGLFHKTLALGPDSLVVFSVISLFIFFSLVPSLTLERPEAWIVSLLVAAVSNFTFLYRLFYGRPYIFTMAVLLFLCISWPKLESKKLDYKTFTILTLLMAASTWIHGSWHLFALPVVCFFLARRWKAAFRVSVATFAGIIIGATLTLHPFLFLRQTFFHTITAFTTHQLERMLVGEFQPFSGDVVMVIAVLGMLAWRYMRGAWNAKRIDNPVFIIIIASWALGFVSRRFWFDWGMPAACIWMAQEFQEALREKISFFARPRLILTIAIAGTLYLAVTNDIGSRWTQNLTDAYLSSEDPAQKEWLPAAGGIIYSNDMTIFYDTFFKNPHADWRYMLGFEPAMMPEEDLEIYRKIQWNFSASESFEPWVKKMRPEDRLVLRGGKSKVFDIPELEWSYVATGIWVARPRAKSVR